MKSVSELKLALKSGEYNGVDIMQAWCTMENQQRKIAELTHALNDLFESANDWLLLVETAVRVFGVESSKVELDKLYVALKQADKLLEGG